MSARPHVVLATAAVYVRGAFVLDHDGMCIWHRGRRFVTGRAAFKIVAALLARAPGWVLMTELVDHAYGDRLDGGPENAEGIIRTIVSRLRPRLEAVGIGIVGLCRWGYRIEVRA